MTFSWIFPLKSTCILLLFTFIIFSQQTYIYICMMGFANIFDSFVLEIILPVLLATPYPTRWIIESITTSTASI